MTENQGAGLIGLRADGSVVATHARVVYAACQGLRGVEGGRGRGTSEGVARRRVSLNVGTDTAL